MKMLNAPRRKLLGQLRRRSKDTHVAIAISPDKTGLILKVDSNALKGRGTVLRLKTKTLGSEDNIKKTLMIGAASLAERQNALWGDDHDIKEVCLKAAEAWYAILKDNKLAHSLGTLIPFSPHSPDNDAAQKARVSRASEEDPLTKDLLAGRTAKWGLE